MPLWTRVGVGLHTRLPETWASVPPPGGEGQTCPSSPSQLGPSPALGAGMGDSRPLVDCALCPRTCSQGPALPAEPRGLVGRQRGPWRPARPPVRPRRGAGLSPRRPAALGPALLPGAPGDPSLPHLARAPEVVHLCVRGPPGTLARPRQRRQQQTGRVSPEHRSQRSRGWMGGKGDLGGGQGNPSSELWAEVGGRGRNEMGGPGRG